MRKWTYLVAALLMSGTAATFTSCIDNEEPAGIEAMRTAKADFYAAQAAVKQAQVAYQDALTAYQEQLVKEMELKNKALEIANQLAEATTAKDIAALEAAKTELLAQHEVKMQQIAANKAMADAALEKALVEMAKVVSAVNGEYTAEYARLLAKVTDNNAKYNMAAAKVTELRLQVAAATMNALDTASVRLQLQTNIDVYNQQLTYLQKQYDLLTTISAPDANTEVNMQALDKQIRELANDFNNKVAEMKTLFERKTKEKADADALKAQYDEANKVKYSKEVVAKIAVPENIQHDFITKINDANAASGLISANEDLAEATKVNGVNKYSLKDQNDEYVITVKELTTQATTVTGSTTQTMSNKLSTLLGSEITNNSILKERFEALKTFETGKTGSTSSSSFNKETLDKYLLELESYKNAEAIFKAAYEEDLKAYQDVLDEYKPAVTNYMYNSDKTYYQYLNGMITELTADLNGTDATKKAAAQKELLPVLQNYGKYRQALDGWAYATAATEEPLYKTIQESAITAANAVQILGSATLQTTGTPSYKDAKPHDEYPYAAIAPACQKAFGTGASLLVNIPNFEDELFARNPDLGTSFTWGGSFKEYLDQAKDVRNLEKAKSWNDLVEAVKVAQEVPNSEFITWALEETVQANDVKKLELIVKNTQIEINKLGYEIVNATPSGDVTAAPNAINITYTDNTSGNISSDTNNPNYAKTRKITTVNASGTLGTYIGKLVTVHNGLADGITNYETELTALKADIADMTRLYNNALNEMDEFNNGGYKVTDTTSPAYPGNSGATITINLSDGVTVSLTPVPGDATSNPDNDEYGSIKVEINYPYTSNDGSSSNPSGGSGVTSGGSNNNTSFDIIYKLDWYEAAVKATEYKNNTDKPKAELTATFLKSWIEAKEAEITFWEEKMEDYKKEGEYIQKELDAFLAVINARYPAAQ